LGKEACVWQPVQPIVANRSAPRLVLTAGASALPAADVELVVSDLVAVVAELAALPGWGARLAAVNRTAKVP
jgi:hypothetical protein